MPPHTLFTGQYPTVCVCVNHLNRCKTSFCNFSWFCRTKHTAGASGRSIIWDCYQWRQPFYLVIQIGTPICVPAPIFFFRRWQPAKPRTGMSFCKQFSNQTFSFPFDSTSLPVRLLQSVWREPFRFFSPLVINQFLSGLIGVFFASKIHSTSEFAMTVLSKCACVCAKRVRTHVLGKREERAKHKYAGIIFRHLFFCHMRCQRLSLCKFLFWSVSRVKKIS